MLRLGGQLMYFGREMKNMVFEIRKEHLYMTDEAHIFDRDSLLVVGKDSAEAEHIAEGLPFPKVTAQEWMKAFVFSLNDRKLSEIFEKCDERHYPKKFWELFDDGGEMFVRADHFRSEYPLYAMIAWCELNDIPYYVDKAVYEWLNITPPPDDKLIEFIKQGYK